MGNLFQHKLQSLPLTVSSSKLRMKCNKETFLSWVYYLDVILNSPKKFTWKHFTAGRVNKQSDLGNLWPFMAYSWSFFSYTHGCVYQLVILFLFRCHLCWVSFVQGDVRRLLLGIQVCKEVSVELFCVDSWVCVCVCANLVPRASLGPKSRVWSLASARFLFM